MKFYLHYLEIFIIAWKAEHIQNASGKSIVNTRIVVPSSFSILCVCVIMAISWLHTTIFYHIVVTILVIVQRLHTTIFYPIIVTILVIVQNITMLAVLIYWKHDAMEFLYNASAVWDTLPNNSKESSGEIKFKNLLKRHILQSFWSSP